MFRGDNPAGKLAKVLPEEIYALRTRSANITCERLEIVSNPPVNNNLRLKVYTSANDKIVSMPKILNQITFSATVTFVSWLSLREWHLDQDKQN